MSSVGLGPDQSSSFAIASLRSISAFSISRRALRFARFDIPLNRSTSPLAFVGEAPPFVVVVGRGGGGHSANSSSPLVGEVPPLAGGGGGPHAESSAQFPVIASLTAVAPPHPSPLVGLRGRGFSGLVLGVDPDTS